MRSPEDLAQVPRPPRSRRRIWLIVLVAAVIIFFASLRSLAGIWTDQLWFASEGKQSVFNTLLLLKVGMFLIFGIIFAVALWINLNVVDRIGKSAVLVDPEDEMVRRYQTAVHPYAKWMYVGIAALFGLGAGAASSGQWQAYLLFIHAQSFGVSDPQFGKDVGFYVFRLPFIQFLIGWFLISLIIITIVTAIFHYFNGGIRGQRTRPRVRPAVKVHLSVLLALIALGKAVGYFYQRYELTTSTNGYVEGATYTDVHARLPAIELLFWMSLIAAIILLVNIWRQGWTLPVVAVGLWAFVALVIGVIYPTLLQTLKVTPAQSSLESPYIARNIAATRDAFGLTHIVQHTFEGSNSVDSGSLQADALSLANIRLWDPDPQIALQTFQKLQDLRSYYTFQSLGVDRYTLNGGMTPTLAGVRQLNAADLPAASWVNTHLEFTHGTGMALAPANDLQTNGNPVFGVGNVPPASLAGFPQIDQSGVFFGLNDPGYVVVNSKQPELDYQTTAGVNVENHYTGKGGVQLSSFARRAAFALRLGDFNLLISNLITPQSRILSVRDVTVMAQKVAPFLSFDANPYSVLVNGHIDWILDGYTTTSMYPYSQNASSLTVPVGSGLPGSFNYVRNSVKVVINAYSGQMTFYVIDKADPIIRAYEASFPSLFTDGSKMPADVRAHLRYPEDIFSAQMATYGRYHITNPSGFYNAGDSWNISPTAGAGSPSQSLAVSTQTNAQGIVIQSGAQAMAPIYQVNSLPGSTTQTFTITDAYVPASAGAQNQNLSAFLVGTSDPSNYGQLNVYVTPSGQNVIGPVQADSEIQQNTKVSSIITPLDQHGSSVLLGNILMIPINQAMLYVRPLYVTSTGNSLPQLKYVIAVFNSHVDIESSLSAAISNVLSANVNLPNGGSSSGTSGSSGSSSSSSAVAAYLAQAQVDYQTAQTALQNGDLAGYQAAIQAMYAQLVAAQAAISSTSSAAASSSSAGTSTQPAVTTTTVKKASVSPTKKSTSALGSLAHKS
jgi:uncharacterized membrane protein (UPF0182 family)